jgi:hypothetical protein
VRADLDILVIVLYLRCLCIVSFRAGASSRPAEEDQRQRAADAVRATASFCVVPDGGLGICFRICGSVALQRALPEADVETRAALEAPVLAGGVVGL